MNSPDSDGAIYGPCQFEVLVNWVWDVVLEEAGAAMTWFVGLGILLDPVDLPAGGIPVVPTLASMGVCAAAIPPTLTAAENA